MGRLSHYGSRLRYILGHGLRRGINLGHCTVCDRRTVFCKEGDWLRDQYKCMRCYSIPRWRSILAVLEAHFPKWRDLAIHESSPGGAASEKIARECRGCIQTHWYPDVPLGTVHEGFRCEDLERQTFGDEVFDLVISQDVFEHVLDPARGFAEIARTLKPGGAHVFTIPWFYWNPTLVRAVRDEDGKVRHLVEPDYHGNPIDPEGSLVITEWGADFCDFIYRASGLTTTVIRMRDRSLGIDGEFGEIFISRKAAATEPAGRSPAESPSLQDAPIAG